ncbi:MAG: HAD family phosphatase [Atopobiaceae bacterium]|nr:HAD family phosphatase [Atopobiaceae bacterium]MDO4405216.1 HAD family hydrolase [Atopobiaceae bacterium]
MVKLVLTDMDNTLVAYEIPASERAIEGIHKLLDKGVLFGPASGRDYDSVVISFRGDKDCVKTALFSNGKRIFVDGSLINQTGVDRDNMVTMAKMVYDLPGVYVSGRGEGGGFVTGSTLPSLLGTTWGGRRASELVDPDDIPHWTIVTAGLHFEEGSEEIDNEEWGDKIRAACPKLDLLSPGSRMFDVVPHGWSKASAVRVLQILMAIDKDEIVAFGDSDNDLEMLKAVGHPVAVANANDRVKAVARHFIGSVDEDAVGQALNDLADLGDAAFDKWDAEAREKGWMK